VSCWVPERLALEGLLHDAAEAYVNDLNTPLKHSGLLEAYRTIENTIENLIFWRFGLEAKKHPEIKLADDAIYRVERAVLFGNSKVFTPLAPFDAKNAFLNRFAQLFKQRFD
jgi:uncharacterized protein